MHFANSEVILPSIYINAQPLFFQISPVIFLSPLSTSFVFSRG